ALPGAGDDGPQYYEGTFGDLAPGAVIEYAVQCQLQGRNIEPSDSTTLSFEVEKAARRTRARTSSLLRSSATPLVGPEPSTVPPNVLPSPPAGELPSARVLPQPQAVRRAMTMTAAPETLPIDARADPFARPVAPTAGAVLTEVPTVVSSAGTLHEEAM